MKSSAFQKLFRRKEGVLGSAALLIVLLALRYRANKSKKAPALITEFGEIGAMHNFGSYEYDFIIVGGGTAGCVLASRLSEDPSVRVLVLESGGSAMNVVESRVPSGFGKLFWSEKYVFQLYTEPQEHLPNDRKLFWPRARMLGGCSSINAQMAQYGSPQDFDQWGSFMNDDSWSWKNFRKYINKFENYMPDAAYPSVDVSQRGSGGPMRIGYFNTVLESSKAFVDACVNIGIPYTADFNGENGPMGASRIMTYIDQDHKRVSSESAYLTPDVLARPNLKVAIHAHVTRILFDEKKRAIGVEYSKSRNGPLFKSKVKREVILSAGAVHSPHILMLSGVGPAAKLKEHGIPVVHDLPGVGDRLVDHPVMDVYFKDRHSNSVKFLKPATFWETLKLTQAIFQYTVLKSGGPLATNMGECAAFVRSDDPKLFPPTEFSAPMEDSTSGSGSPDLELFSTPLAYKEHGKGLFSMDTRALHVYVLKPLSYGKVTLTSSNAFDLPNVNPNYLQHPSDLEKLLRGTRLCLRIATTKPFSDHLDTAFMADELDHELNSKSDDELKEIIKCRMETLYHPTSTCRMAPLEEGGVVDSKLRVYGISGLRVCDASFFPWIISGHTAGACLASAEKLADELRAL